MGTLSMRVPYLEDSGNGPGFEIAQKNIANVHSNNEYISLSNANGELH